MMHRVALLLALMVAGTGRADVAPASLPPPARLDPEHALTAAWAEVARGDLDGALTDLDALLAAQPNFRLAHLLRGDLLAARAGALAGFGAAAGADAESLADLRAEAELRLAAQRAAPAPGLLPAPLLALAPSERHALVYDAARARLYLFAAADGVPVLVRDFYASHGKLGADKRREGDKRTPVGVYRMAGWLAPTALTDFYGAGAFPISYPNAWDRREGRDGFGIWLHGAPRETYARAPRASDGCVVLANADVEALRALVDPQRTPVVIAEALEWLPRSEWVARRDALLAAVERWRRDWESREPTRYLAHYAVGFVSGEGQSLAGWRAHKQRVLAASSRVEVGIEDLSVQADPLRPELAVVSFVQDYAADNLSDRMAKRQYWVREGSAWRIAWEGAVALDQGQPQRSAPLQVRRTAVPTAVRVAPR